MDQPLTRYNTADAMLDALQETGVSYLFSNLGSDHPTLIEGLAKAKAQNRPLPQVIMCPHEYVALSAAHGHSMLSGKAQALLIHTDVGTQNLGGSLHNAQRSRIPVFIFAGETPYTLEGELPGSRNTHVNHLQNVFDQHGIVRSYVKWQYDIRTGKNMKQLVYRGMQLAESDPKGPVYLMGAREVLEEETAPAQDLSVKWKPIEKISMLPESIAQIAAALIHAANPVLITSYVGRNAEAVPQLIRLCETLAIPVIEQHATHMNFPYNHPLHLGFQSDGLIEQADVILVIDSDVPWVHTKNRPNEDCKVFFIDQDPIKEDIPLWYMPSERFYRADAGVALKQLNDYFIQAEIEIPAKLVKERHLRLAKLHDAQRQAWSEKEQFPQDGIITPEWLTVCLRNVIDDETIVLNETITNSAVVSRHLPRTKPETMFVNGGSSLGWSGGAALGAKLAKPDKMVVNLTGDATYLFSIPSSVYWMSRRYQAPIMTVIYNNQGWNATKLNLLRLHPDGIAQKNDQYWVNFDQPGDLAKIAEAAGGAFARTVEAPEELQEALRSGVEAVNRGQSAVIDVRLLKISQQVD